MTATQFKAMINRDTNCLFYFGANRKAFLTACSVLRTEYDVIVKNSLRELEDYGCPPQYTIEVHNGKWFGWNVVNSERYYGERYWEGRSRGGLPVVDLSRQKAVIL